MSLVPVLRLYAGLDLNGTFLGVWLAHTGFGLPLAIFLLYNYISQLPGDLFEIGRDRRRLALPDLPRARRCRCPCPRSRRSRSSSSCGSGTTCWSRWCTSARRGASRCLPARLNELVGTQGRVVAPADRGRVRDDGRAAHRVPAAPAVLRPRADRGFGQGVTSRATAAGDADPRPGHARVRGRPAPRLGGAAAGRRRPSPG